MLLRQEPKEKDGLIGVNEKANRKLQELGYTPKYFYDGVYYYKMELKEFLEKTKAVN